MAKDFELNCRVETSFFEQVKLGSLNFKNRFVVPAMCTYLAEEDSCVNIKHLVHYLTLARGGASMVIVEATAIEKSGCISKNDLIFDDMNKVARMQKLAKGIKNYGCLATLQIAHAGRKAYGDVKNAISNIPFDEADNLNVLTTHDLDELVAKFTKTAMLAKKAGFDAIEIHAAHGYLIHQLLSPLTNTRTDKYSDRNLFLMAVVATIKQYVDIPIIVRLSATEYAHDGLDLRHSVETIKQIENFVDIISISSGGGVKGAKIKSYPGYQLDFCTYIKKYSSVPLICAGQLESPEMINYALNTNKCDIIGIGKASLVNPFYVKGLRKE